jgi:hypothetical protein
MTDIQESMATLEEVVLVKNQKQPWAMSNGRYWQGTDSAARLPAGVYGVGVSQRLGPYLDLVSVVKDDLVMLPDMGADEILGEIKMFLDKEAHYRSRGMVHKRGILMHGVPGSGKTSTSELLIELFIQQVGGIVFALQDPAAIAVGIGLVRALEPTRPVMVVLEDIDGMLRGGAEEHLLNLLDGKQQFDRVIYVATTNHLAQLPERIANRPSRFDLVINIGVATAAARLRFLEIKEPDMSPERRLEFVAVSEGYSIAHLKELLLLTEVYEKPLDEAAARIQAIVARKLLPSTGKIVTKSSVPFGINAKVSEDA